MCVCVCVCVSCIGVGTAPREQRRDIDRCLIDVDPKVFAIWVLIATVATKIYQLDFVVYMTVPHEYTQPFVTFCWSHD